MSRLDQIRDRLQHATPGPWYESTSEDYFDDGAVVVREGYDETSPPPKMCRRVITVLTRIDDLATENAALIAAAPDDLAYLLACVDGLRGALEDIELVAGGPLAAKIRTLLLKHDL